MFLIRSAGPKDREQILGLARLLDSYNLPYDRAYITELLRLSQASFQGNLRHLQEKGKYLFVMEQTKQQELVGCSLIIAQHGQPGLPHVYLQWLTEAKSSRVLRKTVSHQCLQLGWTTNGPTEVGGLVVKPQYRRRPEQLGRQLSYVRFVYMAMHPERFRNRVLVEYMSCPPHEEPWLWKYLGQPFTGLTYQEAERLSARNKEFILALFPREKIYCDLLPESVMGQLGRVSPEAEPACRLLQRIGFRRLNQVDVFDGGPCYDAGLRQLSLIRRTKRVRVKATVEPRLPTLALCAREGDRHFYAAQSLCRIKGNAVEVPPEALKALHLEVGESVVVTPIKKRGQT